MQIKMKGKYGIFNLALGFKRECQIPPMVSYILFFLIGTRQCSWLSFTWLTGNDGISSNYFNHYFLPPPFLGGHHLYMYLCPSVRVSCHPPSPVLQPGHVVHGGAEPPQRWCLDWMIYIFKFLILPPPHYLVIFFIVAKLKNKRYEGDITSTRNQDKLMNPAKTSPCLVFLQRNHWRKRWHWSRNCLPGLKFRIQGIIRWWKVKSWHHWQIAENNKPENLLVFDF